MCDTLVARTGDGIIFAKNSDRDPNEAQIVRWYRAADHPAGTELACTWTSIPQAAHTHAVALSQPWWMWGAEMGANEMGVVVGNQAVFTRGRTSPNGLLGMDLVRLALERADSAEDAVEVIVELLERHGQGGSCSHEHPGFRYDNSFLVADPSGAIVVETAGRAWATETVSGRGRSISNGFTIAPFAKAHADPVRARVARCATRRSRTEAAATSANGVADMFAALRDHGDDPTPRFARLNGALGAPCAHAGGRATSTQTTASWVADLRGDPLHWVTATSAPCTSIFKPLAVDEEVQLDGQVGVTNHFDASAGWWRHEQLHRTIMRDHPASIARLAAARDRVESAWLDHPPTTGDAFATAEALESAWLTDLVAADLPDRRPRWLRNLWDGLDRSAEMPRFHRQPAGGRPASGRAAHDPTTGTPEPRSAHVA